MTDRESVCINLDFIQQKLNTMAQKPNHKLRFEIEFCVLMLLNTLNVNISLFSSNFSEYNYSLITMNVCLILRRILLSISGAWALSDPTNHSFYFIPLNLLIIGTSITLASALINLFEVFTLGLVMSLIFPIASFLYLYSSQTNLRYSEGFYDCYFSIKQIYLNSVQILFFGGYLPYKLLSSKILINLSVYMNALFMLGACNLIFQTGELLRKRGVELSFHAHTTGNWRAVKDGDGIEEWNSTKTYLKGENVWYNDRKWRAVGRFNMCKPGLKQAWYLYFLFEDPGRVLFNLNILTGMVLAMEAISMSMTFQAISPSYIISIGSLIYILFRNIIKIDKIMK